MAINPGAQWPGQTTAPDADYPYGSSKNETAPGANDGTPYEKIRADDLFGLQQSLLKAAGIVPSGNADKATDKNASQYAQALLHLITAGNTFDDSGVADVYVLDVVDDNPAPADYTANMTLIFTPSNTNTGASTVDVESLGAKDIVIGGVALGAGALTAGDRVTIVFDILNDRFELVTLGSGNLGALTAIDLTLTGDAASPPDPNTLTKENTLKGWINFDGSGTIAIRSSFNVSSIVDEGAGNYTINWDTDFADDEYSISGFCRSTTAIGDVWVGQGLNDTFNSSATEIQIRSSSAQALDSTLICVNAVGNQ